MLQFLSVFIALQAVAISGINMQAVQHARVGILTDAMFSCAWRSRSASYDELCGVLGQR